MNFRKNKFGNRITLLDGIKFDSEKEARRYSELKLLQRAGEIKDLELQVKFELQPSYKKNGKTVKSINYVADFVYYDLKKKQTIVEDTKGYRTKEYILKKKIFEYKYKDLTIKEI